MPREKEDYRDILADMLEYFGGKRLLSATEAARYLGIERRTAIKNFNIPKEGIMIQTLARRLCG